MISWISHTSLSRYMISWISIHLSAVTMISWISHTSLSRYHEQAASLYADPSLIWSRLVIMLVAQP